MDSKIGTGWDFFKWFIARYDKQPSVCDLAEIKAEIQQVQENIMAKFEDVESQAQKNTAALKKSNAEIRAKLDEILKQQADMDKAIADAVAAAKAGQQAEFEAKLDAIKGIQDEQSTVLAEMDAQIPDKPEEPTEPPTEPPVEPPVEPPTEPTEEPNPSARRRR